MRAIVRVGGVGLAAALVSALAGCYESPKATVATPGVYKGAPDPLLAKLREPQMQKALADRVKLVERDR